MSEDAQSGAEVNAQSGLVIWIDGVPRPQPRPRFVGKAVVSTIGKARGWKDAVRKRGRDAVHDAGGLEAVRDMMGAHVRIEMEFRLGMRSRADADNLAKLVMDALMDVGALGGDDRRVVDLVVRKVPVAKFPGVMVAISPVAGGVADTGRDFGAGMRAPGWLATWGREHG